MPRCYANANFRDLVAHLSMTTPGFKITKARSRRYAG